MRQWVVFAAIGTALSISYAGSASEGKGIISGNYVLDESRGDDAFQVIEGAIAPLSTSERPLLRTMLRKSIAVNRMRISAAGSRVGITYDDKAPIILWLGGEPVRWKLIEPLVFDVSAKSDGDAVSLRFLGKYCDRVMTYRMNGKDLVAETTMSVPQLSKTIIYKQIFSRTN